QLGDYVGNDIVLVRGLFRRAGNNQRGSGLVDQNIVHFIDDNKVELSLDVLLQGEFHVVPQVIEPELVVRSISDICAISFLARNRAQIEVAVILGQIARI